MLVYHRFADLGPGDSQALAVKPERFAEQLEVLRGEYRVRPLRSLLNCEAGTTGAVAVTADDGYADNLHEMKPRLAQAGVPASVFVTTGYVGAGREYWWDELERTLLHPGRNRRFVELTLDRKHRSWPTATVSERAAAFGAIRAWLMKLGEEELGEALVQLRRSAGEPDAGAPRDTHRPMNVDELSELAADGLVEIGAHTHSHVNLAAQPLAVQRAEISRSKRSLETWLDRPVPTFAYPFGWRGAHYGRGTRDAVLAAGFEAAVTMHPWAIHSRVDRYQIPRYVVGDWDGHELERRLHDLLEPPSRAPRPAAAECSRRLRV